MYKSHTFGCERSKMDPFHEDFSTTRHAVSSQQPNSVRPRTSSNVSDNSLANQPTLCHRRSYASTSSQLPLIYSQSPGTAPFPTTANRTTQIPPRLSNADNMFPLTKNYSFDSEARVSGIRQASASVASNTVSGTKRKKSSHSRTY